MESWIVWLIIVIVLAFIEIVTINLVTVWFVLSGIISLIISVYIDNLYIQFAFFVIGGVLFLLITRPFLKKLNKFGKNEFNTERIIGKTTELLKDINPTENGFVRIDGKEWNVFSDKDIAKGKKVKILEIKGTKLKVEEIIWK